jgi:3-oxoacyl-[acyl-carrier-protein] synthase II
MKRRRVKITGIGFVTPAGVGRAEFERGILESRSRVVLLDRFPPEAGPFVGAEVAGFKLEQHAPGVNSKRMPRHTQFAVAASVLAAADAGLKLSDLRDQRVLVMIGAALMDFGTINKGVDLILRNGPVSALPTSVSSALVSSIGSAVAELIGGSTRMMAVQSACCSGLDAIGSAADMIATGEVDVALCGGTEAPLHFHPMLELKLAGLSPGTREWPERQCRPFDLWRTTGVIGEGACVLLLEAEGRGRVPYAHVAGHAFASDHSGEPCSGLFEAMRLAVANARMRPHEVEVVSAWGPGHRILDRAEAQVLARYFTRSLAELPAYSLKGALGNPLGAAGAIQAGCAALGLREGILPPTVNWSEADPECPLNLSAAARYIGHQTALVNAHGLSGTNTCLVLRK